MFTQASQDVLEDTRRRVSLTASGLQAVWEETALRTPPAYWESRWASNLEDAATVVIASQYGALQAGEGSVEAMLDEMGTPVPAQYRVDPSGLAGWATSTWQPGAETLIPLRDVLRNLTRTVEVPGFTRAEKYQAGMDYLERMAHTQVSDAMRFGQFTAMTARNDVGYVRMVNPPCCSRCAVLSGRFYRYNSGFQRHPGCDCSVHVAVDSPSVPEGLVGQDIRPDQITDLTKAERKLLENGGNLGRVLNATRNNASNWYYDPTWGIPKADRRFTTVGTFQTSAKKWKGRRLSPLGIVKLAGDDLEMLRKLMIQYQYVTP